MKTSVEDLLKAELERLTQKNHGYLGYPLAKDFSFEALAPFLNLQINNVGDPFTPSSLAIDTKEREIEVLHFFSKILRAPVETTWGYVTNGGSEGNLYGLYLAREAYQNGLVYYSESTHYSVKKNLHLLNIPNIVIRSQANGEMDYKDLDQTVRLRRHCPAIFFLNVGTTMTEAIDQLDKVKSIITKYALKDFYIHIDGALAGIMAPFYSKRPQFDFHDGIDSISISGHKFIGSPLPCGVVLCKKEHSDRIAKSISYVKTKDTTITGSRNGITPLILWYALKKMGVVGLRNRYETSKELADYTLEQLKLIGYKAWKNENAITVVLQKPSDEICQKYQLAVQDDISHIICMPGVEKNQIDQLINDLKISQLDVLPFIDHFNAMLVEF